MVRTYRKAASLTAVGLTCHPSIHGFNFQAKHIDREAICLHCPPADDGGYLQVYPKFHHAQKKPGINHEADCPSSLTISRAQAPTARPTGYDSIYKQISNQVSATVNQ